MTSFARRAAAVYGVAAVVASSILFAGPAGAAGGNGPQGWANDPSVSPLQWLTVLLFIPLGAAIVISLIVLLPGVVRGEGLLPKPFPKDETHQPSATH
jgi:hypothetical protein